MPEGHKVEKFKRAHRHTHIHKSKNQLPAQGSIPTINSYGRLLNSLHGGFDLKNALKKSTTSKFGLPGCGFGLR